MFSPCYSCEVEVISAVGVQSVRARANVTDVAETSMWLRANVNGDDSLGYMTSTQYWQRLAGIMW
jgi:hypothetical protein